MNILYEIADNAYYAYVRFGLGTAGAVAKKYFDFLKYCAENPPETPDEKSLVEAYTRLAGERLQALIEN